MLEIEQQQNTKIHLKNYQSDQEIFAFWRSFLTFFTYQIKLRKRKNAQTVVWSTTIVFVYAHLLHMIVCRRCYRFIDSNREWSLQMLPSMRPLLFLFFLFLFIVIVSLLFFFFPSVFAWWAFCTGINRTKLTFLSIVKKS